jgi:hypothetical protein
MKSSPLLRCAIVGSSLFVASSGMVAHSAASADGARDLPTCSFEVEAPTSVTCVVDRDGYLKTLVVEQTQGDVGLVAIEGFVPSGAKITTGGATIRCVGRRDCSYLSRTDDFVTVVDGSQTIVGVQIYKEVVSVQSREGFRKIWWLSENPDATDGPVADPDRGDVGTPDPVLGGFPEE